MKKRAYRKVAIAAVIIALLPAGYYILVKNNNGSVPQKRIIDSIMQQVYDWLNPSKYEQIIPDPTSDLTEGLTPTKEKTEEMINSPLGFSSDEAFVEFCRQIELQMREDVRNYNTEEAQLDMDRMNKIMQDIVNAKQPCKNYSYDAMFMNPWAQVEITGIASRVEFMHEHNYPPEMQNIKEYQKNFERIASNFLSRQE